MAGTKHWNILVPNGTDKEGLIKALQAQQLLPDLAGKRIELYSTIAIGKFIWEEETHDIFVVSNERGQALKSMSSGERKKALLNHILSLKPDAIILDNPLDSLDVQGRADLIQQLNDLATQLSVVNIVSRTRDFLDLDSKNLIYENGTLASLPRQQTQSTHDWLTGDIPEPVNQITVRDSTLIHMKDVHVSYGERRILKYITWQIKQGEFWQLKGPNGAGKTTLLTMITGDNHKAYGQDIRLFGFQKGSGESVWDIKKNIGYYTSTMTYDFWRNQSIEHMIISGYFDSVGLYDRPTELQHKRTEAWLALIGLENKKDKPFIDLPIGWRRLILIIRAMVKHPPLLILDEPTSDLDDENTALMIALINKIAKESKTAILYVSHQDEDGLEPDFVFELMPESDGSVGKTIDA